MTERRWESRMAKSKNTSDFRRFREFYDDYDEGTNKKKVQENKRPRSKVRDILNHIDLENLNDEDFYDLEDY